MRVTILVTHLLGSGHLARAAAIARAADDAGHAVLLISGGRPGRGPAIGGATLLQLPPLASDGVDFARLLDAEGRLASEALLAARRRAIGHAVAGHAPDVVLTEHFPFGRRALAAEFEAAIEAGRAAGARIAASVRDILVTPSKPARIVEAERRVAERYDLVLVHSDPKLVPLEASWPVGPALAAKLAYTGFVAPEAEAAPSSGSEGRDEILVAAGGGGAVGDELYAAAIGAARSGGGGGRRWRLLVGGDPARRARLAAAAEGARVLVEALRPDFRALLGRCALFVGQCGYNTAIDLLLAGPRAVLTPFEDGGETEQRLRAEALAARLGYGVVPQAALGPERLTEAVDAALGAAFARPDPTAVDLDGARRAVGLLAAAVERRGRA